MHRRKLALGEVPLLLEESAVQWHSQRVGNWLRRVRKTVRGHVKSKPAHIGDSERRVACILRLRRKQETCVFLLLYSPLLVIENVVFA